MNLNVEEIYFSDDGVIPNNTLPVLLYRQVCLDKNKSDWFESTFAQNGWTNNWRDIVLPYDHFHSTTHEVLGIGKGEVKLQIGGKLGKIITATAGDMIVLPAGVGHFALPDQNHYEMVGGYPDGRNWDLLTGSEDDRPYMLNRIKNIPLPLTDPIQGIEGTLLQHWKA